MHASPPLQPSLIPDPPPPPGPVNSDEQIYAETGTFTLAAGAYLYTNWSSLFTFPDSIPTLLENHGAIYQVQVSPGYGGVSMGGVYGTLDVVKNTGIIVGAGRGEFPSGATLFNEIDILENTGQIYALSDNGSARVVLVTQSWDSGIINDGLLAAKSSLTGTLADGFRVTTVDLWNGVWIHNKSNGEILAEGWVATALAVEMYADGKDFEVYNEGRIEARSLEGGRASVGVQAFASRVFNSGLIKADIAVALSGKLVNSGTVEGIIAVATIELIDVTNQASGILRGDVLGDIREDVLRNQGQMFGNVSLGAGVDRVENSGNGSISGIVDLGIGNDVFIGAAGVDRVAADNDHDDISGGDNNDLLLGGNGDDRIAGDDGNDGLFGERGNDLIVTSGADYVFGGRGDDRVELGDYAFEYVGGGTEIDTLVLPSGARILDLASAIASGRIEEFEVIELRGSQEIVVRAADVEALVGSTDTLRFVATATDKVDLVGAWVAQGNVSVNGADFAKYVLDDQIVLVSAAATVTVMASAPAGATGLDAIAAGAAALVPGDESGLHFTPDQLQVTAMEIIEPTTIYEGETWFTIGKSPAVYGQWTTTFLENNGTLDASNTIQATAVAMGFVDYPRAVNNGTIRVTSTGALETIGSDRNPSSWEGAFAMQGGVSMVNNGTIDVYSLNGMATAFGRLSIIRGAAADRWIIGDVSSAGVGTVQNSGLIRVRSDGNFAVGQATGLLFDNVGDLFVVGKLGALAVGTHDLTNSGTIEASILNGLNGLVDGYFYESIAISLVPGDLEHEVVNSGRIAGDVAIQVLDWRGTLDEAGALHLANTGTIEGRIHLLYPDDVIDNDGLIAGNLWLGDGADSFDGSGGTQTGIVYGEGGADRLVGGAGVDNFVGGSGADDLTGNGGADRFIYQSMTDSSDAALDRIRGFQSGIDKIDLTALGWIQLGWSAQADADDGSLWQLVTVTGLGASMSFRVDGTLVRSDFIDANAGVLAGGTTADDQIAGSSGNDALFAEQGGNDRVTGHDGHDGIYFGGAFTALDIVDGGAGTDSLALQGVYAALTLGDVRNIELLVALPGNDTRFGYLAGDATRYVIASTDANVAAGATMTIQASELRATESISFDGSAELDGHFRMFAGRAVDHLTGGAGSDGFFFGADGNLTAADRILGGPGIDSLALRGNYVGARAIVFQDATFGGIEVLAFLSGFTNEHGGFINSNGFSYDVTLSNGNIAAGQRLDIIGTNLRGIENMRVDARAELDGSLRILGGGGFDRLFGGAGDDVIYGGMSSDQLVGGAGRDTFIYRSAAESTIIGWDTITDYASGDRIDLSLIDAIAGTAANDAFTFIGMEAFSGVAGQLSVAAGSNGWWVQADVNGDGQADLAIAVWTTATLTAADFVL